MRDCENCKHRVMKVEVGKGTPPEHFWGCECWECEFEPIIKNDLGVDAVSRKAVHDMLENLPITVEDKWFNWLQKACMRLAELPSVTPQLSSGLEKNSKKLEKNFGELDCISRADAIRVASGYCHPSNVAKELAKLPSVTPQEPKCKDCKWWKDSDGVYRRGCGAESQCPINRRKVFEGNGYCYLYEPQEREE